MFDLRRSQHEGSTPRGTPRNFCPNGGGGAEKSEFWRTNTISETWQDRTKVTFVTNEDE